MTKFISTLLITLLFNNTGTKPIYMRNALYTPIVLNEDGTDHEYTTTSTKNITYLGKDLTAYDANNLKQYYEYSKKDDTFNITGSPFSSGFIYELTNDCQNNYSLYILDGKYKTLEFDYGHVDHSLLKSVTASIYADGTLISTYNIPPDSFYQHDTIDVTNVKQIKIEVNSNEYIRWDDNSLKIGFGNVVLK